MALSPAPLTAPDPAPALGVEATPSREARDLEGFPFKRGEAASAYAEARAEG
jgi:hypothetical protein